MDIFIICIFFILKYFSDFFIIIVIFKINNKKSSVEFFFHFILGVYFINLIKPNLRLALNTSSCDTHQYHSAYLAYEELLFIE